MKALGGHTDKSLEVGVDVEKTPFFPSWAPGLTTKNKDATNGAPNASLRS